MKMGKKEKQKSFSTKELSSSRTQQKSTIYMFKTTYCRYVTYPWKARRFLKRKKLKFS